MGKTQLQLGSIRHNLNHVILILMLMLVMVLMLLLILLLIRLIFQLSLPCLIRRVCLILLVFPKDSEYS